MRIGDEKDLPPPWRHTWRIVGVCVCILTSLFTCWVIFLTVSAVWKF